MPGLYASCPTCGHHDLDPRKILVGLSKQNTDELNYQEITTLKCQQCGWLGEQPTPHHPS